MSRAGDPTALTWSLLGMAVAYSTCLVLLSVVLTASSGGITLLGVVLVLLPLGASLAVLALLQRRREGYAVAVTVLVLLVDGYLMLAYLLGIFLLPVVVLLGAAIIAPRRRWDRA